MAKASENSKPIIIRTLKLFGSLEGVFGVALGLMYIFPDRTERIKDPFTQKMLGSGNISYQDLVNTPYDYHWNIPNIILGTGCIVTGICLAALSLGMAYIIDYVYESRPKSQNLSTTAAADSLDHTLYKKNTKTPS